MKGIDKRTHKDGTVSYRARVRIKGHPVIIQSFSSKTLAMKWKRDTESANGVSGKNAYLHRQRSVSLNLRLMNLMKKQRNESLCRNFARVAKHRAT